MAKNRERFLLPLKDMSLVRTKHKCPKCGHTYMALFNKEQCIECWKKNTAKSGDKEKFVSIYKCHIKYD